MDWLERIGSFAPERVSVEILRGAWRALHGKAALQPVTLGEAGTRMTLVKTLRRWGCGACDDDRHELYHLRAGRLLGEVSVHESECEAAFLRALAGLDLQAGDQVISVHDHQCAMDCEASDARFLFGVLLV